MICKELTKFWNIYSLLIQFVIQLLNFINKNECNY